MLMPSIFGENLFDDFFDDFARPMNVIHYANPTPSAMKTDVKETDAGYELDIDLPGYKKEDVKAELKDGYMTISAEKKSEDGEKDEKSGKYLRRERYYGSCSRSFYVGEDVTEEIRLPEMSLYASAVSAIPEVRAFLLEMQRDFARKSSVIMDGRDIGTVVLPHADVKIFLKADVEVRARRREIELQERGTPRPYKQVLEEMRQRDYNDTHRSAAPLRAAEDAVIVDTSDLDFQQSKEKLLEIIREKVGL